MVAHLREVVVVFYNMNVIYYREELEKQRATAQYRKLHAAGKTEEARADLERLAIIRQKRAEAEEKRKEQQDGEATCFLSYGQIYID